MLARFKPRRGAGAGALLLLTLVAALALVLFSSQMTRDSVNRTRGWSSALSDARTSS